jgi:quercetin dioxygenase-like cupin family protein
MSANFTRPLDRATFSDANVTKQDLFGGTQLFVGLNCFERGQAEKVHAHAGADKLYFLVSGKARMAVGHETRVAAAGELIVAPAGTPHGVLEALERTVMLVAIAPSPSGGSPRA